MKSRNRLLILGSLAAVLLFAVGCAHKSGHIDPVRRNNSSASSPQNNNEKTQEDVKSVSMQQPTVAPQADNAAVPVAGGQKLEGSQIFAKYNTAVFMVFTSDGYNGYQGSGFFINSSGLALSNYHVFQGTSIGAEQIKLVGSDTPYKVAEVIHSDEEEDFILYRVNVTGTNYIPLAPDRPNVGEKVYAIGSPRGLENTFSSGEVSAWRERNLMQISALIDHGSSGGALINEYGQVVGITSGSFYDGSQANLNYAWSIEAVKPYL